MSTPHKASNTSLPWPVEQHHQQQYAASTDTATTARHTRRKRSSASSNGTVVDKTSALVRRRSGMSKNPSTSTSTGLSYPAQMSAISPDDMSTVHYTKTGRVSKAKKGLKVHECECGRSYTRAEHLRRHQRNHAQEEAMICKYPGCGKVFYRSDLLQRHEERHNELGNVSRHPSVSSPEHSAQTSPTAVPAVPATIPSSTLPPTIAYTQQQTLSPQLGSTPFPRYNPSLFRTPQVPRTPKNVSSNPNNNVFLSSLSFKTPTNDIKQQSLPYVARHSISGPVMSDNMATTTMAWHDSFAPSPYSCSSGNASPAPGIEYNHVYATPPYGNTIVRTRASSNASFIEQQWAQASQSPTSSVGLPYSWPTDEKGIIASTFPYTTPLYSTTDMSAHSDLTSITHYGAYDPHNVVQMDLDEGTHLFPGEQYGMSQTLCGDPYEQRLNNYWRLFHPTFPIVHRFTFARLKVSPMLYAAMVAIDLYYSNDPRQRRKAWELHKTCVKLLNQREIMRRTGCDRLCDSQAIFLVEVFAQYCAQRCSKSLSPRFERMFKKLAGLRAVSPLAFNELNVLFGASQEDIEERWEHWVKLSTKQHLLLSCCVLEAQQSTLLGRDRQSHLQTLTNNLPFPVHESWWGAETASEWTLIARDQRDMPATIREALQPQHFRGRYDLFQSTVLITLHQDQTDDIALDSDIAFEDLLSNSPTTRLQLFTAKLAHLIPMRALLAVTGETWVFGTKLTSEDECAKLTALLQTWIDRLWLCPVDDGIEPAAEAVRISIAIMELSLETDTRLALGVGNELGIFIAALVLWIACAAAAKRVCTFGQHPPSSLSSHSQTTTALSQSGISSYTLAQAPFQRPLLSFTGPKNTLTVPQDRRSSISYTEIFSNTSRFLSTAMHDITSLNLNACYTGCTSVLLWVKMHLRGAFRDEQPPSTYPPERDEGELINEAIGQLKRMLDHGWDGLGI